VQVCVTNGPSCGTPVSSGRWSPSTANSTLVISSEITGSTGGSCPTLPKNQSGSVSARSGSSTASANSRAEPKRWPSSENPPPSGTSSHRRTVPSSSTDWLTSSVSARGGLGSARAASISTVMTSTSSGAHAISESAQVANR
jgi:hypothetical protein